MPSSRTSTSSRSKVETGTLAALAFGLTFAAGVAFMGNEKLDTSMNQKALLIQPTAQTTQNPPKEPLSTGNQLLQNPIVQDLPNLPAPAPRLSLVIPNETRNVSLRAKDEVELFNFTVTPSASSSPIALKYFNVSTFTTDARRTEPGIDLPDMHLYANGVLVSDSLYRIHAYRQLDVRQAGQERAFIFNDEYLVSNPTRFSIRSSWTGTPRVGQDITSSFAYFLEGRTGLRGQMETAYVVRGNACSQPAECSRSSVFTWSDLSAGTSHSGHAMSEEGGTGIGSRASNDWLTQYSIPGFSFRTTQTVHITGSR